MDITKVSVLNSDTDSYTEQKHLKRQHLNEYTQEAHMTFKFIRNERSMR